VRQTNYDEIAATYDRRDIEEDYGGIERALTDFIEATQYAVLDVGCGTGHWLRVLQHHVRSIGIDLSRQMLLQAHTNVPSTTVVRARAESLPFVDGSFERVFTINAHHHFADKRSFLGEARRVLRSGGSLMTIALDPHIGSDQWWIYDYFEGTLDIDKQRYPPCEQIRAWMREVGFTDTYTREVQHLPGNVPAGEALESGMISRSHTSQLAVLTREEYDAGMERIRAALRKDSTLRLSADLRVYATYGKNLT